MWPSDKRFMIPEQFRTHVDSLDFSQWRPIGVVWHNTAEPTLKRWHEVPRRNWMVNLEAYYKSLGWSGGPHLFIDDGVDGIGLFNPLNARGTHSPSFNAQWIGIEHVGDYAKEDDDAGPGLRVKLNGIAATAILCARLGIDPTTHIKLHKEDPRTDHDCPGKDMAEDKAKSIQSVIEYMGEGGDHAPNWGHVAEPQPAAPTAPMVATHVTTIDALNVRELSSASSARIGQLSKGAEVAAIGVPVLNGSTAWQRIRALDMQGWVAARYLARIVSGPGLTPPPPVVSAAPVPLFKITGKMSTFGGPRDGGMSPIEGLAIFETLAEAEAVGLGSYFMSIGEAGFQGLGRRLRVEKDYVACRWDYTITSRKFLQKAIAWVSNPGRPDLPPVACAPMDWGPHVTTGRVADLSPATAAKLKLDTDGTCTVTIRANGQ